MIKSFENFLNETLNNKNDKLLLGILNKYTNDVHPMNYYPYLIDDKYSISINYSSTIISENVLNDTSIYQTDDSFIEKVKDLYEKMNIFNILNDRHSSVIKIDELNDVLGKLNLKKVSMRKSNYDTRLNINNLIKINDNYYTPLYIQDLEIVAKTLNANEILIIRDNVTSSEYSPALFKIVGTELTVYVLICTYLRTIPKDLPDNIVRTH